jgi:2-keto-4-pentenoate hydratase
MSTGDATFQSGSKWRSIAHQLISEHRAGIQFRPFAAVNGVVNLADAYCIQREYVRLQQSMADSSGAGYKIGLTSRQMQKMCGINSPVSGVITSDRVFNTPAELQGARFGRLGLEFEIAVRMGKDVRRPDDELSIVDVATAVDAVGAAIELVDDRRCDYDTLDVLSLVADNSWNAGIVHGAYSQQWGDLSAMEGIIFADGIEIGRGFGRDALGHPFIALAWLANHLADDGTYLRAGDIVMTGSLIETQFPSTSTYYEFNVEGLGQVSCRVNL